MEQKWIPQVFTALENDAFCVDRCDFFAFNSNTVCSMRYVTFFVFVTLVNDHNQRHWKARYNLL